MLKSPARIKAKSMPVKKRRRPLVRKNLSKASKPVSGLQISDEFLTDPKDAIRAAVEGFAKARNTGNVSVSFRPDEDRAGHFEVNIIDLSEKSSVPVVSTLTDEVEEPIQDVLQEFDLEEVSEITAEEQIRSNEEIASILSGPEMMSVLEFADAMNLSRQEIEDLLERDLVIGLRGVSRRYKFPRWQFRAVGLHRRILDGVEELLGLSEGDHWAVYNFLITSGSGTKQPMWTLLDGDRKDEIVQMFAVLNTARRDMGSDMTAEEAAD